MTDEVAQPTENDYQYFLTTTDGQQIGAASTEMGATSLAGAALVRGINLVYVADSSGMRIAWVGDNRYLPAEPESKEE